MLKAWHCKSWFGPCVLITLWIALPAYAGKWTDITGRYSVEAEFVVLESGAVTLKKQDGTAVRVPLEKLCADDQRRAQDLHNQLCAYGKPGESSSKWRDVSGKYSAEAAFISIERGNVTLRKKDGVKVIVAVEKLSTADQQRAIALGKRADNTATSNSVAQKPTTIIAESSTNSVLANIASANVATIAADDLLGRNETVGPKPESKGKWDQRQSLVGNPNGAALFAYLGAIWNPSEVKQIGHWIRNTFILIRDSTLWAWVPANDSPRGAAVTNVIAGSSEDSATRELLYGVLKPLVNATDPDVKLPANFMYVRFSKPFLEKYFCTQIDRTIPVRDTILGASVMGTSRTIADSTLELINNASQAQGKLRLVGTTRFQTVAASGPIQIYSKGTTTFTSTQQIWFDGFNLQHHDDGCVAQTRTVTTGIGTCLRFIFGRISLRIASRREAQSHSLSESITSEHTKQRVERAFDSGVANRSTAFREFLTVQYAKLPIDGEFKITDIRCSTSPTNLQIVVVGGSDDSSLFVSEPAALAEQPDIELDIHTALVRKAIAEPELRKTLEHAAANLIDRPLQGIADSSASKTSPSGEQGPNFHWPEGSNSNWLSISWNMKAQ